MEWKMKQAGSKLPRHCFTNTKFHLDRMGTEME